MAGAILTFSINTAGNDYRIDIVPEHLTILGGFANSGQLNITATNGAGGTGPGGVTAAEISDAGSGYTPGLYNTEPSELDFPGTGCIIEILTVSGDTPSPSLTNSSSSFH